MEEHHPNHKAKYAFIAIDVVYYCRSVSVDLLSAALQVSFSHVIIIDNSTSFSMRKRPFFNTRVSHEKIKRLTFSM